MSAPARDILDVTSKAALVVAVLVQVAVLSWLRAHQWQAVRLVVAVAATYGVIGVAIIDGPGWVRRSVSGGGSDAAA